MFYMEPAYCFTLKRNNVVNMMAVRTFLVDDLDLLYICPLWNSLEFPSPVGTSSVSVIGKVLLSPSLVSFPCSFCIPVFPSILVDLVPISRHPSLASIVMTLLALLSRFSI